MPATGEDDLPSLSATELEQAYVVSVRAAEATEHVGRKNRLGRQRAKIVQELKARGKAREVLERLLDHSDESVRSWATANLDWLEKPTQPQQPGKGRFWPQIQWQSDHPPPPALDRDEVAKRLRCGVPKFCNRLTDLARPAIGLWPQRRDTIPALASRFGGMPLAPAGWQWPVFEKEPRLFVGQINCAELRGLPGAESLPSSGLFAFFGDHDAVTGCFPFDEHCVFYWPDVGRLVPAEAAIAPLEIFPSCALTPRPFCDLPHPDSRAVSKLTLNQDQRRSYFDVWQENRAYGIPRKCAGYAGFSKLLGWPDFVQNDLCRFQSESDARLLLQVDKYCNGEQLHCWGPGGSLFYVISERDLQASAFNRCGLEGQFT
jgi:uncharacterized protein YwqG